MFAISVCNFLACSQTLYIFSSKSSERAWCSHLALQIFDRTGQKFALDFNVQIFERLGVQIFVRLALFLVNEVPNRTNFRPGKNSTSSV